MPFNIPIEFEGEPMYGEHDIQITVRYKDSVRDEIFQTYDTTIFLEDTSENEQPEVDYSQFAILGIAAGIGGVAYTQIRKRKKAATQTS